MTEVSQKKVDWWAESKSLLIAILVAILARTFLYAPFVIPSGSMKPTLLIGDFLLVSKFSYGYTHFSIPFSPKIFEGRIFAEEPKLGDVVVFRAPSRPDTDFIKRLVGLPGDRIQVKEGVLYINDVPCPLEPAGEFTDVDEDGVPFTIARYIETLPNGLKHMILKSQRFGEGRLDNTQVFIVPEGHYFLMGDNRDNSEDSRVLRTMGYIPFENLIGRAEVIFLSVDAKWYQVWRWITGIRFERIFELIR
ncbi:MAG: signal peptidase I [Holosporales bacterium]